ncbi:MAG: hypothetical protein JSV30_04700 [Candidatus Omnitrophota bacterium]|nr:MAG: hypothetical protein JSV30_04700 [Candidatus Omnitrophota bacterium]
MISVPLGIAAGFTTHSALAGMLCLLSGTMIDVDHAIEYIIHYGWHIFNPREVYRACSRLAKRKEEGGVKTLHLFFHAVELALLLWVSYILSKNIYFFSIALGYTGHLIADMIGNNRAMKTSSYFITIRVLKGFNTGKLIKY